MSVVWSCGGGVQSAAIAALIVSGKLPKPDCSVIADTGREASATWRYFDAVLKPRLAEVGIELHRLPHSFDGTGWNTVDLFSGKNKDMEGGFPHGQKGRKDRGYEGLWMGK